MTNVNEIEARQQAKVLTREDRTERREHRKQIYSVGYVILVLLLLMYLTFVPIPAANKDLVVSVISVIVAGLTGAIAFLFKGDSEELEQLKDKLDELALRYEVLKSNYDEIVGMLVKRIDIGALGPVMDQVDQ